MGGHHPKGRRPARAIFAATLLLTAFAAPAGPPLGSSGGPYRVFWHEHSGSAAAGLGGSYALDAVIGQADAATLAAGPYRLRGGFLPPKAAPELRIFRDGFEIP